MEKRIWNTCQAVKSGNWAWRARWTSYWFQFYKIFLFRFLILKLLTKPKILFVDEATSGLDSFSAFAVMNILRDLAGNLNEPKLFQKLTPSRIILFSIHQPTSNIFHLFTNIILMNAGRIIFHGTVGEAQTLFTTIGLSCPPLWNPAEFYVNKISRTKIARKVARHVRSTREDDLISIKTGSSGSLGRSEETFSNAKVSWTRQVVLLSHRAILGFVHNPRNYLIQIFILMVSWNFKRSFTKDSKFPFLDLCIPYRCRFLRCFLWVCVSRSRHSRFTSRSGNGDFVLVRALRVLHVLRSFAIAEKGNWRSTLLIISILCLHCNINGELIRPYVEQTWPLRHFQIPRVFFESFLYTAVIYFSSNIGRDFQTYLNISFSISLSGICAMAYGFFLSGLFENVFIGVELSAIVDLTIFLVSGMYISVKTLPVLKYISFFFYANETIFIHFWKKVDKIKCKPKTGFSCFPNGKSFLESLSYGTTDSVIYRDYLYQAVLTILLLVMAFIGIRKNVRMSGFY